MDVGACCWACVSFGAIVLSLAPSSQAPPPVQQQQQTAVAVVNTVPPIVQAPAFRDYPVVITDSNGNQVTTVLDYRVGTLTWIVALGIFLFTLGFGLCCLAIIPFFINDLKDVYHISPTDGTVVGVYRRA